MDAGHFDHHIRSLSESGTRRRVLHILAVLPAVGGLSALIAGDETASARHRPAGGQHQSIAAEKHKKHKKKCARAGQPTNKKHKQCCQGLVKGPDGVCKVPVSNCDVCASGCRYATIQAAVGDPAGPGTIRICPGRYREKNVGIGKSVTLIGAGQGNNPAVDTILDATGLEDIAINIGSVYTVGLQRMRITGGGGTSTPDGGGIFNGGSMLTVTDCTITGNRAANGGGIFHLANTLTLIGTTVTSNNADHGGGIFNAATLVLGTGSHVGPSNSADEGGGIYNLGSVTCSGGTVSGNTTGNCVDFPPGGGCGTCPAA